MKRLIIVALLLYACNSYCQKQTFRGISFYNAHSAMPFSKFGRLISGTIHPGLEVSQRKIFSRHNKHDWFWDVKASVFYHRFVQWGIPLSVGIGYRYKILHDLSLDASLSGGYMHSIPDHQKFKLNSSGNYQSNKGIGRSQANANIGFVLNYTLNPFAQKRVEIFTGYYQEIQMPFIKSYVPLLPYNQLAIGIRKQIK